MRPLIDLCFRRPVTVMAFFVLVVVLAGVAFVRVPVSLLPDLRFPALMVWTAYPDVPPERVERVVTERIEAAVAGTTGLTEVASRSLLGGSLVRLDFGWNTDMDLAQLDVREQLDRLGGSLPEAASRPVVLRLAPSERPILMVALREAGQGEAIPGQVAPTATPASQDRPQDLITLKRLGREVIARRLEGLSDIARVRVTGGYERRIEVQVDPDRLAAHGISLNHIGDRLRMANVALSGGMIRRGPFRYAVEVTGEFKTTDDVGAVIVHQVGGAQVRLRDVAIVRESVEERRGLIRLDGAETLLLLVERRPDANTVEAAAEVRQVLRELELELPRVRLDVVVDESVFIRSAIGGVARAVLLGGLLALAVLFVFLRHARALLAVAVAVPLSLALALVLFDLFDVTFNLLSLSGLALGVGMLVDNAIVVVENIARLREAGQGPLEAARNGVAEVAGAITSSTLTTIAVFLPLTFVEGLAGRLFRDQSLAVVCSLLASLLVALTAVPLLARAREQGRGVIDHKETGWSGHITEWGARLVDRYERALAGCLDHRGRVLALSLVALAGAAWMGWHLPREVVPAADQGRLAVHLALPTDADLPLVSARASDLTRRLHAQGLAERVLADLGERDEARLDLDPRPPYEGTLIVLLPPGLSDEAALRGIRTLDVPPDLALDVQPVRTQLEALLVANEADLLIDLTAELRAEASAVVPALLERLRARAELADVRRAEAHEVPAFELTFRREALARYGVAPAEIGAYLEAAARGRRVTELRRVSEEVPIVLQAGHLSSLEALLRESVPAGEGLLPLGTFVEARPVSLEAALLRSGQAPVVRLLADVAPGYDLRTATGAAQDVLADALPQRVRAEVGGAAEGFRDSLRALAWSLLLSVLLVYLILAAQFEHLGQPLVVLAAVPLAVVGVTLVLGLTGHSVNLMSLTGCVVLVGIVVNDAIIKVDFINQRREAGLSLRTAVLEAGRDRLRPIVMTTLTTVLGLLPLAFGLGQGGELQAPLAVALAGGLLSSTILTLFVVPTLYTLLPQR
jgi:HAE1 family hydrophobic/amphiphilic exporter-1